MQEQPKNPTAAIIGELATREATSSRKHKGREGAHIAAGVERMGFAGPVKGAGNTSNNETPARVGALVIAPMRTSGAMRFV